MPVHCHDNEYEDAKAMTEKVLNFFLQKVSKELNDWLEKAKGGANKLFYLARPSNRSPPEKRGRKKCRHASLAQVVN